MIPAITFLAAALVAGPALAQERLVAIEEQHEEKLGVSFGEAIVRHMHRSRTLTYWPKADQAEYVAFVTTFDPEVAGKGLAIVYAVTMTKRVNGLPVYIHQSAGICGHNKIASCAGEVAGFFAKVVTLIEGGTPERKL